jgi:hypothetical protein
MAKTNTAKANKTAKPKAKPVEANGAKAPKAKKISQLDAAALVLKTAGEPLNCQKLVDQMSKKKLWTSPNGKTPAATLSAALQREIKVKGAESRFVKADRGLYALA